MGVKMGLVKTMNIFNEAVGRVTIFWIGRARGLTYEKKVRYSSDKKLYLNVAYKKAFLEKAKADGTKLPILFYIHGGGWVSSKPENRKTYVSKFAADGYFTVNIFYGLSPKYTHEMIIKNIYDALAWVADNAEKYSLNLDELFVGGESAGGHLAALVGAIATNDELKAMFPDLNPKSKDLKPIGLMLNCGIFDMETAKVSGFPLIKFYLEAYSKLAFDEITNQNPRVLSMSPERFVTPSFPPSSIYTAKYDSLKVGGKDMVETLQKNNVPVTHYYADKGIAAHAFAVAQCLKCSREALAETKQFFDGILTEKRTPAAE